MSRKTKAVSGLFAALALVAAFAGPAAAAEPIVAPNNDITVEVGQVDGGLEIGFYCAAVGTGTATNVDITSCTMEYRTYPWSPVEASTYTGAGNTALAVGHVTGLQGGEDHYRENTWVCWEATAYFIGSPSVTSTGCEQVA